jgi:hypothetical protein
MIILTKQTSVHNRRPALKMFRKHITHSPAMACIKAPRGQRIAEEDDLWQFLVQLARHWLIHIVDRL